MNTPTSTNSQHPYDGQLETSDIACPDGCGRNLIKCYSATFDRWFTKPCDCRYEEAEQKEKKFLAFQYARTYATCGIPPSMTDVPPERATIGWFAAGHGVWVHSPNPVEATTAACSMLRGWIEDGRNGSYVTEIQVYERDLRNSILGCGLLVIDGLGFHKPDRWEAGRFRALIEHRFSNSLPIIVSSTMKRSEVAACICEDWNDSRRAIDILGRMCMEG